MFKDADKNLIKLMNTKESKFESSLDQYLDQYLLPGLYKISGIKNESYLFESDENIDTEIDKTQKEIKEKENKEGKKKIKFMKYIKLFEDIDWDWVQEEKNPHKEIPYEKDGVIYGKTIHIYKIDISDLKFQLEDKVMCVKDGNDRIVEKIGKVVDYYFENYLIYFDDNIRGHGQNNIPSGHAWYVKEKYLKKI